MKGWQSQPFKNSLVLDKAETDCIKIGFLKASLRLAFKKPIWGFAAPNCLTKNLSKST
ncbi:hypothetical protein HCU40_03130 [Pseudanabaena biceps]|nr:hypothetical protein [Pseudanabaena biceps]